MKRAEAIVRKGERRRGFVPHWLRFMAEVNGIGQGALEVGERKVNAPETLDVGTGRDGLSIELEDAPDLLTLAVQGWDRDHPSAGFCSVGTGLLLPDRGADRIKGCFDLQFGAIDGRTPVGEFQAVTAARRGRASSGMASPSPAPCGLLPVYF